MKLKTRVRMAWFELGLVIVVFGLVAALAVTRPHPGVNAFGVALDVVLALCLAVPPAMMSWRRLRSVRAQLAERGPDAEPKIDLWSAPGGPGVLGLTVVVLAVAFALLPALALRS